MSGVGVRAAGAATGTASVAGEAVSIGRTAKAGRRPPPPGSVRPPRSVVAAVASRARWPTGVAGRRGAAGAETRPPGTAAHAAEPSRGGGRERRGVGTTRQHADTRVLVPRSHPHAVSHDESRAIEGPDARLSPWAHLFGRAPPPSSRGRTSNARRPPEGARGTARKPTRRRNQSRDRHWIRSLEFHVRQGRGRNRRIDRRLPPVLRYSWDCPGARRDAGPGCPGALGYPQTGSYSINKTRRTCISDLMHAECTFRVVSGAIAA